MKYVFVLIVFLGLGGCKVCPPFECPECPEKIVKRDSIIRIIDSTFYDVMNEATLRAIAECDSNNKVKLKAKDSIIENLQTVKPVTRIITREIKVNIIDSVIYKQGLKKAYEIAAKAYYKKGLEDGKKQSNKPNIFVTSLWLIIVIVAGIIVIKLIK